MRSKLITLICCIAISSMVYGGGGGSSSGGGGGTKSLFSVWTNTQNQLVLDLTQFSFDTPSRFDLIFSNARCSCFLTLTGNQTSGSYILNACGPNNGICPAQNQSGSYLINSNSRLRLTDFATGNVIVYM